MTAGLRTGRSGIPTPDRRLGRATTRGLVQFKPGTVVATRERPEGSSVTNAIQSAIDNLVNQIPGGQTVQQNIKSAFVNLLDQVVRESTTTETTTNPASTPTTTTSASATQLMPTVKSGSSAGSLWKDANLQGLAQLSNDLTADDPAYNEREATLRDRLNVSELESRLRGYASSMGVEYSSTDLDGILRNAGYGAAHLGSSDRYMSAVEHFTDEAFKNYRERSSNVPGPQLS
jgi:hypothetical protein